MLHSDSDSIEEDRSSQAMLSSGEEDGEVQSTLRDSAPQLIMPSLKMPSRRPFTEKGKSMGTLKILIAGSRGKEALRVTLDKLIVR